MEGGETALFKVDKSVLKIHGPEQGIASVLQGRYIEHMACKATGGPERITMVTSYRPKSPFFSDETVLTTVRPVSDLSQLYGQYTGYRLEILEERIRAHQKTLRRRKDAHRRFDTASTKSFLCEQKDFIDSMLMQLVDEEKVVPGLCDDEGHLFSNDLVLDNHEKTAVFKAEKKIRGTMVLQ